MRPITPASRWRRRPESLSMHAFSARTGSIALVRLSRAFAAYARRAKTRPTALFHDPLTASPAQRLGLSCRECFRVSTRPLHRDAQTQFIHLSGRLGCLKSSDHRIPLSGFGSRGRPGTSPQLSDG
jgi:hypothetical protein